MRRWVPIAAAVLGVVLGAADRGSAAVTRNARVSGFVKLCGGPAPGSYTVVARANGHLVGRVCVRAVGAAPATRT